MEQERKEPLKHLGNGEAVFATGKWEPMIPLSELSEFFRFACYSGWALHSDKDIWEDMNGYIRTNEEMYKIFKEEKNK